MRAGVVDVDESISLSDDGTMTLSEAALAPFAPRRMSESSGAVTQPESGSIATRARPHARRVHNLLRRRVATQSRTGAALPDIRMAVSRTWELLLAQRIGEARELIDQIESHLHDLRPLAARRLNEATQLLRAVSLAFEDHWLAAFAIAQVHMDRNGASGAAPIALTLSRLGLWKLTRQHAFQAMPRRLPRTGCSRAEATSAAFDLAIEAAFAIDHLRLATAKRLATSALRIVETSRAGEGGAGEGLALLPLSLIALVHYEQGDLDAAERLIRDRLPLVDAEGTIESALRCYLVLARIARHRMRYDLAAILLRGGEALGERRGWPRLVVACAAERVSLLLEIGRHDEARLSLDHCDRTIQASASGPGPLHDDMAHDRTLAHCRLSWADARSEQALATFQQLYFRAVEFGTLYSTCRLATEYAAMLASNGQTEDADAIFLSALKLGTAAGLYQPYLEGGEQTGAILERICERIDTSDSADRDLLPVLGGLLCQWQVRHAQCQPAASAYINGNTLTRRELDILNRICRGLTNKSIARTLGISPETVKSHAKRIFIKLGVSSRSEAVSRSKSLGLL